MLRSRSPMFRVWFAIALGIAAPNLLAIVGRPVEDFFTLNTLLEGIRTAIGGAIAALITLHVDKPRNPTTRTRSDDPSVPGLPLEDRRRLQPDWEQEQISADKRATKPPNGPEG
jgi:hypothetical protein